MTGLQWVPIGEIEHWDRNPRDNEAAVPEVAMSLLRFGFADPCVVWESRGELRAGHTRLKAVAFLMENRPTFEDITDADGNVTGQRHTGWEPRPGDDPYHVAAGFTDAGEPVLAPEADAVPVRYMEFRNENEATAYALASNKLGELAQWTDDADEILREMAAEEVDLSHLGWSDIELAVLLNTEPPNPPGKPAKPPPMPGEAEIHVGDCLEWLKTRADNSIDSLVTDPPYGLSAPPDVSMVLRAWLEGEKYEHGSIRKGKKHCLAYIARNAVRHSDDSQPLGLTGVIDEKVSSGDSGVVMTGSINLDHGEQFRDEQVDRPEMIPVADDVLLDDDVTGPAESVGDLMLDLRPLDGVTACVGQCSCFTLTSDTIVRLPVLLAPGPDDSQASASIVAVGGTEERAVLTLDLVGGSFELTPADGAVERYAFALRLRSHGVGAGPGAGGLPAMPQSGRVRLIEDTTDGTLPAAGGFRLLADDAATTDRTGSDPGLRSAECDPANLALLLHPYLHERLTNPVTRHRGFMSSSWDSFVPGPRVWREVFRVMKPGAHGVVFAGTRTVDLMGIALRLAGFEIRDVIHWAYWSGFPKNHDVSKAIDDSLGEVREVLRERDRAATGRIRQGDGGYAFGESFTETIPASDQAKQWSGWGTALKPSIEPAILIRKPLDGSVAANVMKHGTGGINIDACRFAVGDPMWPGPNDEIDSMPVQFATRNVYSAGDPLNLDDWLPSQFGRWPANLVHCPKPSRAEKEAGCQHLPAGNKAIEHHGKDAPALDSPRAGPGRGGSERHNTHTTVKPIGLMAWLARLVTPPGGTVLDPFAGSGTTGCAAVPQGFRFIGCELLEDHAAICRARIAHWAKEGLPED